jgi:hypothetical protein
MEAITDDDGELLAIVCRANDWPPGLTFCTPEHLFIQAGCWRYDRGKKLRAHAHKAYPRVVGKTQELTLVTSGSMRVTLYNSARQQVREFVLRAGDFAVFANGGHAYEILEDDTRVLEVKNGPFLSAEHDKELF